MIKNKKATTNLKNNNDNCFQYDITAALNYQNIANYAERVTNIRPFINK